VTTEALTGRDNVRRERIVLDVFFAETHKANFAFGDWLRRRVAMNRADRSVAMPWMTSGWALISETGVGVEDLGVRGCLNSLNSFEFGPISLGELPSELASPRTADTTDSTVECRTPAMIRVPTDCTDKDIQRMDSVLSTSSGDAVALPTPTTPVTRGQLRAGPGFQFARNADGRITIGAIAPGGPASAEGSLAVGDELLSVDGLECARASAREVRAAILGDQVGTFFLDTCDACCAACSSRIKDN
jgi:hypothetical protein